MSLSCWEEGPYDEEGVGSTCMLDDGHDGDHEFTSDRDIIVGIAPQSGRPNG